jgi:hypothetical protein
MAHNKIVLVTIHQPSSKIFQMFTRPSCSTAGAAWSSSARRTRCWNTSPRPSTSSTSAPSWAAARPAAPRGRSLSSTCWRPRCATSSGDVIYEENNRGQLVPARRYSPDYWRDKYEATGSPRRCARCRGRTPARAPACSPSRAAAGGCAGATNPAVPRRCSARLHQQAAQPRQPAHHHGRGAVLAALIGMVLRYRGPRAYDFASAFHIPTYLFLALVVAMFLGLTNSADDIIRDRAVLQRERNLNVRLPTTSWRRCSRSRSSPSCSASSSCSSATHPRDPRHVLDLPRRHASSPRSRHRHRPVISALVARRKTAANIVPLVLIPQIILGGALIKYEEMNRNLDLATPSAGGSRSRGRTRTPCAAT